MTRAPSSPAVVWLPAADLVEVLKNAVWVLDCEEASKQGTAFSLSGFGLVTCEHVLGTNTVAYRPHEPSKRYPVTVIARDETIDLAVLTVGIPLGDYLLAKMDARLDYNDPILLAGYPQYAPGKKLYVASGNVVSTEEIVSAVRRFQISARIISGNSGGPVLDHEGRVLGIAVTGDPDAKIESHQPFGVIRVDMLRNLKCPEAQSAQVPR